MRTAEASSLKIRIRTWISIFIILLILSGITAFPLESELRFLHGHSSSWPGFLKSWITEIYFAISFVNETHPQLSYGTDWLAFAHIVIATVFIGPLMDPVKNIWVIRFGMIACVMVFPLAFICGPLRQIPFYWQLIDCSFGLLGLLPLVITHRSILKLEKIEYKLQNQI
jgi:hypothetical protein